MNETEWSCNIFANPGNQPDFIDVKASFKLVEGNASSVATALSFRVSSLKSRLLTDCYGNLKNHFTKLVKED